MIDLIFNFCVELLIEMGKVLGMTYNEINVWLFVVLYPTVFIVSVMLNMFLLGRLWSKIGRKI
jgi:hypothetical protein